MKIKPLKNNLTATYERKDKTKGGLYIGESASKHLSPKKAKILSIGEDVKNLKVGDEIVYKDYATFELKLDGVENTFIMNEEDVLAVIYSQTE